MVYIKYFDLWALWEMKNSNAKVRIEATNLEQQQQQQEFETAPPGSYLSVPKFRCTNDTKALFLARLTEHDVV